MAQHVAGRFAVELRGDGGITQVAVMPTLSLSLSLPVSLSLSLSLSPQQAISESGVKQILHFWRLYSTPLANTSSRTDLHDDDVVDVKSFSALDVVEIVLPSQTSYFFGAVHER